MQNGSLNGSSSKGRLQYLPGGDDHNRGGNDERPVLITGGARFCRHNPGASPAVRGPQRAGV
jgi:hypothetical protein